MMAIRQSVISGRIAFFNIGFLSLGQRNCRKKIFIVKARFKQRAREKCVEKNI